MSRWLWFSVLLTVIVAGGTLFLYTFGRDFLPEQVPVHWDINGKADQWTPRDRVLPYLLIAPGAMVVMILLTIALPWLSPQQFSIERFRATYDYIMAMLVGLMGYIQLAVLLGSVESPWNTGRLLAGGILLFFAALGNQLGKVRRNFFMGVRTPWTLASDYVWNQTHRVAAWLYTAAGLTGFVAVLLNVNLLIVFGVFMVCVLFPIPYSLFLYKRLQRQGRLESPAGPSS
jgi:uncharacterized membrane protein